MVTRRGSRRAETHRFAVGDGLLTRFLREKLALHVEPTRLGTPRGAPVGFSRKKLAAALFALTSADVKQTARELGVAYGVVRKWRTEAAFKALVERLEEELVERFCRAVDAELGGLDVARRTSGGAGPPRPPSPHDDVGARDREGAGEDAGALRPGREGAGDDAGALEPAREGAGPGDRGAEQTVDTMWARQEGWFAANLGDVGLYGPRLMDKLAEHLLDQRGGVGRPGRLWVLHRLSAVRHQAAPGPEWLELGARALLGIVRFIVLVLESASEDHRRLALLHLGTLQRQLVDRPGLTVSRRRGSPRGRAPRRDGPLGPPAVAGSRGRGSQDRR